jgi:hypothetical protein
MLRTELVTKPSRTLKTFVAIFDTKDAREKVDILIHLDGYGKKECYEGHFDNFARCWCNDDSIMFVFTLRTAEYLGNAEPKWTKGIKSFFVERGMSVTPRCIRVFVVAFARVLQVLSPERVPTRDTYRSSLVKNDGNAYTIEVYHSKDVPFYISKLMMTNKEKLDWMLVEQKIYESLTQFAEVYCNIFDSVKDVPKKYLQVFALWQLYTSKIGQEVTITKRSDLSPRIQSELLWAVERIDQKLCHECGKKSDVNFCSLDCEVAGKKLKCTCCTSIVFERSSCNNMVLCSGCQSPLAATLSDTARVKRGILGLDEIETDESHVPAWKIRKKAST